MTTTHKDPRAVIEQLVGALAFYLHEAGVKERNDPHYGQEDYDALDALTAGREALATQGEVEPPVAWFAFADSNGPVPLELYGWDEKACKYAVLMNARSVGWKGTLDGYLYQQGWTIKPVYTRPQASEPVGINGLTEAETSASMSVLGLSKPTEPAPSVPVAAFDRQFAAAEAMAARIMELEDKIESLTQPAKVDREQKIIVMPVSASAGDLKVDITELIQSHKYKGLRSVEVLGVFQFLGAEIISGSTS